jgi:hypothetical protein
MNVRFHIVLIEAVSRNLAELEAFVDDFRVKLVTLLFSKYYLNSFVNVVLTCSVLTWAVE